MEYKFVSLSNEPFSLTLPAPTGRDIYFVAAPAKAGSVLLFNVVSDLAQAAERSVVDLPGQAFAQGVVSRDFPFDVWSLLETPGHIFIGLRDARFLFSLRAYRTSRKILLVRDPRDMVVSLYHSVRYSHAIPPKSGTATVQLDKTRTAASNMSLESFLNERWADGLIDNMRLFSAHVKSSSNFSIFRYEDIIFDKQAFVAALATALQIEIPRATIIEIANRHDIWPTEERPNEHIRQVRPGNYKSHLSPTACRRLEYIFGDVFQAFNYPTTMNSGDKELSSRTP